MDDLGRSCCLIDMFPGAKAMVQAVFRAKHVEPRLRELITLRSGYLLSCPYEWQASVVMATNAGCTQGEIEAMTTDGVVKGLGLGTDVVMLSTDELTRTGTLTDDAPGQLRDNFDDVSCRKLVLIIAWFNLLARFLNGSRVRWRPMTSSAVVPRPSAEEVPPVGTRPRRGRGGPP